MKHFEVTFCVSLLVYCCNYQEKQPVVKNAENLSKDQVTLMVAGLKDPSALLEQARSLGLNASGNTILVISGAPKDLAKLTIDSQESAIVAIDEPLEVRSNESFDPPNEKAYFLARRDFGLPDFLKTYPSSDGRGVVVGIIDDGISPPHSGFQKTTTGQRKHLRHGSNSTALTLPLTHVPMDQVTLDPFLSVYDRPFNKAWKGSLKEYDGESPDAVFIDLNKNGKKDDYALAVFAHDKIATVCIDLNGDQKNTVPDECFKTFSQSGEYNFWNKEKLLSVTAEFDQDTETLTLSEGEGAYDSHGEGVASVLTGHGINGTFDGVAPGAQFIDYDISASTRLARERRYTISTFIQALDWMGQNGAEVINISYSLYFLSPKSQLFMRQALSELVEKYKYVVNFSAGNNGPGLGSFNRALIYPSNALVVGAYASADLMENVHGVSGLKEPGRVIWYSSVGPGPDAGSAPSVISPLASLTHSSPNEGLTPFSGTSSATPAVAGLVAVLLSHVKQQNWPVDYTALAHAIRLSAVPLEGVPYVEQGMGLPKIERAIELYQRMVTGKDFIRVESRVSGTIHGVPRTGVFIRASEHLPTLETTLTTWGTYAETVDPFVGANLSKTVRIEYSEPWVTGPKHAVISVGNSYQYIAIDTTAVPHLPDRGGEYFAEIQFIDEETNRVLNIVPVTYIDDMTLQEAPLEIPLNNLEPEQGIRFHINIPPGVDGFSINTEVTQGDASKLRVDCYDPSSNKMYIASPNIFETLVATPQPGWYQVAFYRNGGTPLPLRFQAILTPLSVSLSQSYLLSDNKKLTIKNYGKERLVRVKVTPSPKLTAEKVVSAKYCQAAEAEFSLADKGKFKLGFESAFPEEFTNWNPSCYYILSDASGKELQVRRISSYGSLIVVGEKELGGSLKVNCEAFEFCPDGGGDTIYWRIAITDAPESQELGSQTAILKANDQTSITLEWEDEHPPAAGQSLDVMIQSLLPNENGIHIGTVQVL